MYLLTCFVWMSLTIPNEGIVEAKIISISIAVAALLQVCKQAPVLQKYLVGWVAVAVNVGLSIAGVLAVVQPGAVLSLNTWVTVLTAALAAAGIHGTATKMAAYHKQAKMAKLAAAQKRADAIVSGPYTDLPKDE